MPHYTICIESYHADTTVFDGKRRAKGSRNEGLVISKGLSGDSEAKAVSNQIWKDTYHGLMKSIWIKRDFEVIARHQNFVCKVVNGEILREFN